MELLLAALLTPFVTALLMPALYAPLGRRLGIAALLGALLSLALVIITPEGAGGSVAWAPQLGIDLTLHLDGWGRLLALLISGVGSLVILYSILYLGAREDLGKFYLYIMLFMGAMLGVVLSANLLLLYVFWELTSISSFLLIGFWHTRQTGAYGALKSMLLTVSGGLAMLAGIVILGMVGGTYAFAGLLAARDQILGDPLTGPALLLILAGALSKSAQAPFHIWLPDAMAAPTPVSAYLHSATMVKAGLFLVARIWPLLSAHPYWTPVVAGAGLLTMALGAFLALQKTDLKAVLALSTVSQLGLIMALFGYGTADAAVAGVFHLLNHAAFKGLLFMVAGIVDHETGSRDITKLSGLRKSMPVTAALAAVGAAAMAGVPPLNGFISKEMFLEATLHGPLGWPAAILATASAILTTTYCLVLAHKVFFGPETHGTPKHPHEAPWLMLLPPALLAAVVALFGLAPGVAESVLVRPAVAAVTQAAPDFHLALWHGLGPALLLSAIALGGGLAAYRFLPAVVRALTALSPRHLHANGLYNWLWWERKAVESAASAITRAQMTGLLRDYLLFIIAILLVGFFGTMLYKGVRFGSSDLAPIEVQDAVLMVLVGVGAVATLVAKTRLAAVAAIGITGTPISLYFALMRAPDLALTQLVVEVISAVLFLLVFAYLPQLSLYPRTMAFKATNVLIASGIGLMAFTVTLLSTGYRLFPFDTSEWYLANSYKLGGGKNVVNVVLVDFRGWDTMGEIIVLAVTGLAIYALVKLRAPKRKEAEK